MIALGGPKLKHRRKRLEDIGEDVSMIALGGPKLKLSERLMRRDRPKFQ